MTLVVEIATLVAGGVVLALLVPRARNRRSVRRGERPPARPAPLERMEWLVNSGRQTAGDVQVRVRPVLRQIAAALAHRHSVRLDAEPERARALLGDDLWGIVRPDRPRPDDRRAPGLDLRRFEQLTERLEDL